MRRAQWPHALIGAALFLSAPGAGAEELHAGPTDYSETIEKLRPGDTLRLEAGDYPGCMHLSGLHGTPERRIVIDGGGARFDGGSCFARHPLQAIVVLLEDSSYVTITNLEIDGGGYPVLGVRAGFGTTPVHNVRIDGLYIHDVDFSIQYSAISCFATAWGWEITNNVIENVGLGMYLGDSDGTDPFIGGTIENNLILDPLGYGVQIKPQLPRTYVEGMPGDGQVTRIRHNVFVKSKGSSDDDEDARPNLLVGDQPLMGPGRGDRYEIHDNVFFENDSEVEPLFHGEGNLAFFDNVLVNHFGDGVRIAPYRGRPRSVVVRGNTILAADRPIVVEDADPRTKQTIEANERSPLWRLDEIAREMPKLLWLTVRRTH